MTSKTDPIGLTPGAGSFVAPTPQNTPLNPAPISAGLSKPTVPDIAEDEGEEGGDDTQATLNNVMLSMVQGRLASLVGKSSGYIESLPFTIKKRVEGLKGVHAGYAKLQLEYKKELLELDKKYLALYQPVFDRRAAIINGTAEPSDEEVKSGEEQTLKDDPEAEPLSSQQETPEDAEKAKDMKGIPEFWLTALRNHIEISEQITERDEEALKSLTDIKVHYLDGQLGYKITFHFAPNDYFENDVLTKTYYYQEEVGYLGDNIYDHAEGTKISWKGDKDLTKQIEVKKQRNKSTNKTRIVRKTHDAPSFFHFFNPPTPPTEEQLADGDIDEEELEAVEERLELDYQIGEDLKERIIPRAIDYFTGKALEYEMDDEDDEDEDDGDYEDVDEDDDDDDEPPVPKKKGGKGGDQSECKNQ